MGETSGTIDRATQGLTDALRDITDADGGILTGSFLKSGSTGRYIVAYTRDDDRSTWSIEYRKEYRGEWRRASTGKMRLIVQGRYNRTKTKQFPQRKDGSHNYKDAVLYATQMAKRDWEERAERIATREAESVNSKAISAVLAANNVSQGNHRFIADRDSITATFKKLSQGDFDILVKAARAAGILT